MAFRLPLCCANKPFPGHPWGRVRKGAALVCSGVWLAMAIFLGAPASSLGTPASAHIQDENARRLAAQLLVLRGDLRRLQNRPLPPAQKKGLRRRITGMLGSLAWLLRLGGDPQAAPRARAYVHDWVAPGVSEAFTTWLDELIRRHPLDITPYVERGRDTGAARDRATRAKALALHEAYCAACHGATPADAPADDPTNARPARSLYAMAHNQSLREFIARMIAGVRGDRMTALDNPLNRAQIAALVALYRAPLPTRPRLKGGTEDARGFSK